MKNPYNFFPKIFSAAICVFVAVPDCNAQGTWAQISNFGSNPGNLNAYSYVPANMPSNAPLVLVMHGCTETASSISASTQWNTLADTHKFYVVYAEQQTTNNSNRCFNYWEPGDHSRGQGEALSIKQMVDHMKNTYSIDNARVFATGLSAGGAMTAVMCCTYPEVFNAGASMAGLPYKVATSSLEVYIAATGNVDKTPQQWGDLARAEYPSYSGTYPRMAAFHGTSDAVINDANSGEMVEQFANLHGTDDVDDYAISSFNGVSAVQLKKYMNSSQEAVVLRYIITGMAHGIAVDPGSCYQQGGTTAGYSFDVDLYSSFWAAHFFGILDLPFSITGLNQVAINQQGVTYSVPNTSGSTYAWQVPTGADIASGQGTNSITVNWGTTSGKISVTETASDNCKNGPAELFVTVGGVTAIDDRLDPDQIQLIQNAGTLEYMLKSDFDKIFNISVYDLSGRIIHEEKDANTNQFYSLKQNLTPGIYMISVSTTDNQLVKKIVVN